jgi:hypothetical protein
MAMLVGEENKMIKQEGAAKEAVQEAEAKEGYLAKEIKLVKKHIDRLHQDDSQSGVLGEINSPEAQPREITRATPKATPRATLPTVAPTPSHLVGEKHGLGGGLQESNPTLIGCMYSSCCKLVHRADGIPCRSMLHSNAIDFVTSACTELTQESQCSGKCPTSHLGRAIKPMCDCVEMHCSHFHLSWAGATKPVVSSHRLHKATTARPKDDLSNMFSGGTGSGIGGAPAHIDVASLLQGKSQEQVHAQSQATPKKVDIVGLLHGNLQGQDPAEIERVKEEAQQAWKARKKRAWASFAKSMKNPGGHMSFAEQERKKEQLVLDQTRVEDAENSVKQAYKNRQRTKQAMAMADEAQAPQGQSQFNQGTASTPRGLDGLETRISSFHVSSVSQASAKTKSAQLAATYSQLAKINQLEKLQRQMEHKKIASLEEKRDQLEHKQMKPIHIGLREHQQHVEKVESGVESQFNARGCCWGGFIANC